MWRLEGYQNWTGDNVWVAMLFKNFVKYIFTIYYIPVLSDADIYIYLYLSIYLSIYLYIYMSLSIGKNFE